MALILNIDTALQTGSVCLSRDGAIEGYLENPLQKEQATWLHGAIRELISEHRISLKEINAVAVSNGPGSYTGLRIGLSTAKGICYAAGVPLICVNTLTVMASAVECKEEELICPMIDARRMEVYTAVFDKKLKVIQPPAALILNENSFSEILSNNKVIFSGDGAAKFQELATHPNAVFEQQKTNAKNLSVISFEMFKNAEFSDVAYVEPEYVKAAYTTNIS